MPFLTILFGVVLMAVGMMTYLVATPGADDRTPLGLLLPAVLGLVALALGVGASVKKDLRMHLMHGAVLLALMGVIVPTIDLFGYLSKLWIDERNKALSLLGVLLTVTVSCIYVYAAVQSFRAARTARTDDKTRTGQQGTRLLAEDDHAGS